MHSLTLKKFWTWVWVWVRVEVGDVGTMRKEFVELVVSAFFFWRAVCLVVLVLVPRVLVLLLLLLVRVRWWFWLQEAVGKSISWLTALVCFFRMFQRR